MVHCTNGLHVVRIVCGTNSQWYKKSMGRMVHGTNGLHVVRIVCGTNSQWYKKSMVRIVIGTKSLVICPTSCTLYALAIFPHEVNIIR